MDLHGYAQLAISQKAVCWDCHRPVVESELKHYDHDSGWIVDGFPVKQWLYFECPCGYQTSFTKLHIARPVPR